METDVLSNDKTEVTVWQIAIEKNRHPMYNINKKEQQSVFNVIAEDAAGRTALWQERGKNDPAET
ncbi:MAG: hypothetical protein HFI11_09700 [Lachnospiraceae bacterium]|nr:hypothetical protein [Lachnospiraceae bacterium]